MSKLPDDVLLQIFFYLPVRDLCICCTVCRRWRDVLNTNEVWEQRLSTETLTEFQTDPLVKELDSAKDKLIVYHSTWSENPKDHSNNIYVKTNKVTIHRNPVAQSSDLARGKRGFSSGEHYWTVVWHGPKFGSSAVVGVCTERATVQCEGYHPLLGRSEESWGWDLSEHVLRHDGEGRGRYPDQRTEVKVRFIRVANYVQAVVCTYPGEKRLGLYI